MPDTDTEKPNQAKPDATDASKHDVISNH